VYENGALRKIFGPNRKDVIGGWTKLHNKELYYLYTSSYIVRVIISRRMRWMGHVAHIGEMIVEYRILIGKPEGRKLLDRPRRRWEGDIKLYLRGRVNWMHLAQDRRPVADFCGYGKEPSDSIKSGEFLDWLSDCWLLRKDSDPCISYFEGTFSKNDTESGILYPCVPFFCL
jgi:hypothetical protein